MQVWVGKGLRRTLTVRMTRGKRVGDRKKRCGEMSEEKGLPEKNLLGVSRMDSEVR